MNCDSGSDSETLAACATDFCQPQINVCFAEGTGGCNALLTCFDGCGSGDQACINGCGSKASGQALSGYNDIADCVTNVCGEDAEAACTSSAINSGGTCSGVINSCVSN